MSKDVAVTPEAGSGLTGSPRSARLIFAVLAVVAAVLGFWGLWQLFRKEDRPSILQVLYYDMQLFVLSSSPLDDPKAFPVELEIARFLAPAVTIYAILLVIHRLVRNRAEELWVMFLRRHVILTGPPAVVAELAARVERERNREREHERRPRRRTRVVVVWTDEHAPRVARPTVIGDPRRSQVLTRAGVRRAVALYAVGPDSSTTAQICVTALRARKDAGRDPIPCYAEAATPAVFQAALKQLAAPDDPNSLKIEWFNQDETMAGLLLQYYGPSLEAAAQRGVVVLGHEGLGAALVEALVKAWAAVPPASGRALAGVPRLMVIDAGLPAGALAGSYSHLRSSAVVTGKDHDPRWLAGVDDLVVPGADSQSPATEPDRVFVCLRNDAAALSVSDQVVELLQHCDVTVVATVPHDRLIGRSMAEGQLGVTSRRHAATLVRINKTQTVFNSDPRTTGMHENLARAIHQRYLRDNRPAVVVADTNPSFQQWEDLSVDLREANREQAWDVLRKLLALGRTAVPLTDAPPPIGAPSADFTDDEFEWMARAEHERWRTERERQGWTFGPVRNDSRREHPDLVDWDHLGEGAKAKDRHAVRAIPELLEEARFRIVRTKP